MRTAFSNAILLVSTTSRFLLVAEAFSGDDRKPFGGVLVITVEFGALDCRVVDSIFAVSRGVKIGGPVGLSHGVVIDTTILNQHRAFDCGTVG